MGDHKRSKGSLVGAGPQRWSGCLQIRPGSNWSHCHVYRGPKSKKSFCVLKWIVIFPFSLLGMRCLVFFFHFSPQTLLLFDELKDGAVVYFCSFCFICKEAQLKRRKQLSFCHILRVDIEVQVVSIGFNLLKLAIFQNNIFASNLQFLCYLSSCKFILIALAFIFSIIN